MIDKTRMVKKSSPIIDLQANPINFMSRKNRFSVLTSLAWILFLTAVPSFTQDFEIKAYVNKSSVRLNQQFELNVELSGRDVQRVSDPEVPVLDGFASFIGTSNSTSMQFVNGRMSVSKTFKHHFLASTEGKFQIPAITVRYKGETYSTDVIDIEIVKGTSPQQRSSRIPGSPNDPQDLSEQLFLKASVDKRRVYKNEPVIISYKIYTTVNVTNYGVSQLPSTVGFWSEEFEMPQRLTSFTEFVNGRQYQVYEIKKMALFPQGSGQKTLEPMVIECEVQLPRRRRRSRDIFDSFFDDPFSRNTKRVGIQSNSISIEVLPLPEKGKPSDFSGAVGSFSIRSSVDKTRVKTNEAITLKVNISGTGNIKIVPQPKIDFASDFEVYDPKINESIKRSSGQISGSKLFEYVIIPRFPGQQSIKPVTFSYFDLPSKTYRTISTDTKVISVAKGDDQFVNVGIGSSKEDVRFIGQDIHYLQTRIPEFQRKNSVFYKKTFFYVILIFPLIILGTAFAYRAHLDKLSSNVAYARSRKANHMALSRLKDANKQMKANNLSGFYGEVSKALMGFIGDKLNVASAGLITDEVDKMLHVQKIEENTVSSYLDCLKTCDYKRFAPGDSNNLAMSDFFEKAKKAIINLEKEI